MSPSEDTINSSAEVTIDETHTPFFCKKSGDYFFDQVFNQLIIGLVYMSSVDYTIVVIQKWLLEFDVETGWCLFTYLFAFFAIWSYKCNERLIRNIWVYVDKVESCWIIRWLWIVAVLNFLFIVAFTVANCLWSEYIFRRWTYFYCHFSKCFFVWYI